MPLGDSGLSKKEVPRRYQRKNKSNSTHAPPPRPRERKTVGRVLRAQKIHFPLGSAVLAHHHAELVVAHERPAPHPDLNGDRHVSLDCNSTRSQQEKKNSNESGFVGCFNDRKRRASGSVWHILHNELLSLLITFKRVCL